MLPLMRYNEGKNCRKNPSSEPKKNGETLKKIIIDETIKINPV
jgi:hypothetical protein